MLIAYLSIVNQVRILCRVSLQLQTSEISVSVESSYIKTITSGIHGGYRLVSIYDLQYSKPTGAGYFGVNFGHLKSEVFHWGGGGFLV